MTAAPPKPPIYPAQARQQLAKLLRDNSHRHNLYDVFRDFIEMSACAISNSCDLQHREQREARYLQLINQYEPDERQRFPQMLACLVAALDAGPDDVLGGLFGELELANAARGQFFTPYSLSAATARLTINPEEVRQRIAERGFITVQEPACGAGAMVIGMAEALHSAGINYQQHMHVTAIDIDQRAVHMAYLQFSLLGIPAVVIQGNTLTMQTTDHWRTPTHVLGFWSNKLHRGYALGSAMDPDQSPPPTTSTLRPLPIGKACMDAQLDLFGDDAA
jgi:type I restriction-modification system DNA methylase subunit